MLRERLSREWPAEAVGFGLTFCARSECGRRCVAITSVRFATYAWPRSLHRPPVLRLAATLDRAILARELHQAIMAREELDYAERLSAQIDWANILGEARHVLLSLAEVLAHRSATKARGARSNDIAALRRSLRRIFSESADRRWQADEAFAEAVVLRAEGQNDRAIVFFAKAFEIWDAVGYPWRAARAALELAEISGDARLAEYARKRGRAPARTHGLRTGCRSWLTRIARTSPSGIAARKPRAGEVSFLTESVASASQKAALCCENRNDRRTQTCRPLVVRRSRSLFVDRRAWDARERVCARARRSGDRDAALLRRRS